MNTPNKPHYDYESAVRNRIAREIAEMPIEVVRAFGSALMEMGKVIILPNHDAGYVQGLVKKNEKKQRGQ